MRDYVVQYFISMLSLEYDRRGFWPFNRNRNMAERLSAISAIIKTFGRKKIAAKRGYFGRMKLFRPQQIIRGPPKAAREV